MRKNFSILYIISVLIFIVAVILLIASMALEAVFQSEGIFQVVEVAFAVSASLFALFGIILACLSSKRDKN